MHACSSRQAASLLSLVRSYSGSSACSSSMPSWKVPPKVQSSAGACSRNASGRSVLRSACRAAEPSMKETPFSTTPDAASRNVHASAHPSQEGSAATVAVGHHCIAGSEQRNRSCALLIGSGEAKTLLSRMCSSLGCPRQLTSFLMGDAARLTGSTGELELHAHRHPSSISLLSRCLQLL